MKGNSACGPTKMSTVYSRLLPRPATLAALLALLAAASTGSTFAAELTPAQAAASLQAPDLASSDTWEDASGAHTYAIPEAGVVIMPTEKADAPAFTPAPPAALPAPNEVTAPVVPASVSAKEIPAAKSTDSPSIAKALQSLPSQTPAALPASDDPAADTLFINTYRAYQKRDTESVASGLIGLRHHELAAYPELWNLLLSLAKTPSDPELQKAMERFIHQHQGDYIAERARTDWARIAADANDTERFHTLYRQLDWNQNESDLVCSKTRLALESAAKTKKGLSQALAATHRVLQETARPGDKACGKLRNAYLEASPKSSWSVFLLLLQQKRFNPARELISKTDAKLLPVGKKTLSAMLANPAKWYKQRAKRLKREPAALLLAASLRLASSDNKAAVKIAEAVEKRLSPARRSLLWSRLAYEAALNLDEAAPAYFARAGKTLGTAPDTVGKTAILTWNARAALRAGNWSKTLSAINRLPADVKKSDAWIYWRARGLDKIGRHREARQLFSSIKSHHEFYGLLACEALGEPYPAASREAPVADRERWLKNPSVRRAMSFYNLDLNAEGNREWNWALRRLKTEDRLNLASFAGDYELFHREINTSEATTAFIFSQRYPRPHQAEIESAAATAELSPAWVYGLIRQESRFVQLARSSVGAQGMMQVMPRTARWVAAHTAMEGFEDEKLTDTATNLTIGCRYLKLVADAFEGSMPLATAAYNAGPSRSAAWRGKLAQETEGAIFAETIPFTETRNYVQRVLANTVHYATYYNSNKTVIKLSAILGTVTPKAAQNMALP